MKQVSDVNTKNYDSPFEQALPRTSVLKLLFSIEETGNIIVKIKCSICATLSNIKLLNKIE